MDLQVFALHGVHGMAVPTALTVQTTQGVRRTNPVFPSVVADAPMASSGVTSNGPAVTAAPFSA